MTQAVDLNWDLLRTGCLTRKGQCEAALERLRAIGLDNSTELRIRALETVAAGLDTMISECDANLATRYEAAAARLYAFQPRAEFAAPAV